MTNLFLCGIYGGRWDGGGVSHILPYERPLRPHGVVIATTVLRESVLAQQIGGGRPLGRTPQGLHHGRGCGLGGCGLWRLDIHWGEGESRMWGRGESLRLIEPVLQNTTNRLEHRESKHDIELLALFQEWPHFRSGFTT